MLDFSKLKTPASDGEVLIDPPPGRWGEALRANQRIFRSATAPFLGATLAEWRERTREQITGTDDRPVIALGHQPEFIHCGVWAKQVAGRRFADAVGGIGINLVVDSDAPATTNLVVPVLENGKVVTAVVRFTEPPGGRAFEHLPHVPPSDLRRIEDDVRTRMNDRFEPSVMPMFLAGLRSAPTGVPWVEQIMAGRRAVDEMLDCTLSDRRVSSLRWAPFLRDVLSNLPRFASSYNRALDRYRQENRIRGQQRPIPDLAREGGRWEAPFWAYRRGQPRNRVFAERTGDAIRLFAANEEIAHKLGDTAAWEELTSPTSDHSWRLRPRALALTLWARLFLADLFVHGIGGAKYDHISDAIIADYYGLTPPNMVCASATLRMNLPHGQATLQSVGEMRRGLRDLEWNPQRHLVGHPELDEIKKTRERNVRRATELRERSPGLAAARREAFEQIRKANGVLRAAMPETLAAGRAELQRRVEELGHNAVALDREYFYALHPRERLERLAASLPARRDFGV